MTSSPVTFSPVTLSTVTSSPVNPTPEQRLPLSAILFRSAVCVVLVGIGAGIVGALVATKPSAGRNAELAPPQRIGVLEIQPLPIEQVVTGYGTARALESADVPARVAAVVESVAANFAPGSRVAKGDVLVTLDKSDFEKQVAMAEEAIRVFEAQQALLDTQERALSQAAELARSDRELAAADLSRVEKAASDGAAQPREVDRARQGLIGATRAAVLAEDALAQVAPRRQSLVAQRAGEQARLELARMSAARCTITAPIDGVLQVADLERGESVVPGAMIARIVDRARIEIPIKIAASARALAPIGARVEVLARDGSTRHEGVIARVAPEDDPLSRTTTAYVELEQAEDAASPLAPGAFVEARIASGAAAPRIAVPRRAIRDEQIAVIEQGRVRMRRVSIDFRFTGVPTGAAIADTDWAVLDDALAPGTLVVLDGSRSLAEGQNVEPVRATATASAPQPGSAERR